MNQVLLCSEQFVKDISNISDNVRGKLIRPALFESQQNDLRNILGDKLLDKLVELVDTNTIDMEENAQYKTLLIKSQYFLAYSTIANICLLTAVKIDNAGLQQVTDEKMNPISIDDSFRLQKFYLDKADYCCKHLQNFILRNRSDYPELSNSDIHSIKSNLSRSASCGVYLGGPRGRNNIK